MTTDCELTPDRLPSLADARTGIISRIKYMELDPVTTNAMTSRLRWSAHALLSLLTHLQTKFDAQEDKTRVPTYAYDNWAKTIWYKNHVKPLDSMVTQAMFKQIVKGLKISELGVLQTSIEVNVNSWITGLTDIVTVYQQASEQRRG